VIDRHQRAKDYGFGEGSSLSQWSHVLADNLTVGKNVWIGPWTVIDAHHDTLEIGDWCSISAGVHVYTHDSVRYALSGGQRPYSHAPVKIGERCYIGPNAVICAGAVIPDKSIVRAGSIVQSLSFERGEDKVTERQAREEADRLLNDWVNEREHIFCPLINKKCEELCECLNMPVAYTEYDNKWYVKNWECRNAMFSGEPQDRQKQDT